MRKFVAMCLVVLLSACSLGRREKTVVSLPLVETLTAADSVLIDITFRGASPRASKLFIAIKKNGDVSTDLYHYTHRLKDNKLLVIKKPVSNNPIVHQIMEREAELLTKAENIEGYKLNVLDGDYWSIVIHDSAGLRIYSYPDLFQQPNTKEVKAIRDLVNKLDEDYDIEKGRWNLELKRGVYTNYGGEVIEVR